MDAGSGVEVFEFGPFRLLRSERALITGERHLRLGSRAFDILLALVERPGELITRAELIARVWPRLHVDETALRVHISAIRKMLDDDPGAPAYVQNVTGIGYRFVARVEASELPSQRIELARRSTGDGLAHARPIGRDTAIASLVAKLPVQRFVTVAGPGGMGKTTVAREVAERLTPSYGGDVVFIDLTSLADARFILGTISSQLGLSTSSDDLLEDLLSSLRHRTMLLVLDNCEHLVDGIALFGEVVRAGASGVHILATSREPLRAAGEWVFRLQPLALPAERDLLTSSNALAAPAIKLFVDRAQAVKPDFRLTDDNVASVVAICQRLDGIPLAIELAAARAGLFGMRELAAHLDERLADLAVDTDQILPRHRTLQVTLDWSYGLLRFGEQTLFRRLSAFRGRFTSDSALAVTQWAGESRAALLSGLASLVAKSLLVAVGGDEPTYRLFETTRAYASSKVIENGEAERLGSAHLAYVASLFATAEAEWETVSAIRWNARFAHTIDDLRAALDLAIAHEGDPRVGIELTASSASLWFSLTLINEYKDRLETALDVLRSGCIADPLNEVRLNVSLGAALFNLSGPVPAVGEASARALAIATRIDAPVYQLRALWGLARERYVQGDYQQALEFCERFSLIAEHSGDDAARLVSDRMMCLALHLTGRQDTAAPFAERAVNHMATGVRNTHKSFQEYDSRVASRSHYSRILWLRGYPDRAMSVVREGVDYARSLDYPPPLCYILSYAACPIAFWTGNVKQARTYCDLLRTSAGSRSFG